ncbi:MAG: hypothetical protein MUF54_21045 [Polyangiaceae bacterium]|jgi:hypothetical protein|nr:hypothetical protein [Polyangiaceae bacterium]
MNPCCFARFLLVAVLSASASLECGAGAIPNVNDAEPSATSQTAQANLLLYPSNDPESFLGRAVHLTGKNVWTIADARAPGGEVSVKRRPAPFKTSRKVDLSSMTTLAGGLPQLIEIEARYGRSVTADIEIDKRLRARAPATHDVGSGHRHREVSRRALAHWSAPGRRAVR